MKMIKTRHGEVLLFSSRLQCQLEKMPDYPLTVVEAPSGYGKTTAIREYLRGRVCKGSRLWYTCLGESAAQAWSGICKLIAALDGPLAVQLRGLEPSDPDILPILAKLLRGLEGRQECYLVIDNFQLMALPMPGRLLQALAEHGSPGLHIVVLTQPVGVGMWEVLQHAKIHAIRAGDLVFDGRATAAYFQAEGLSLSQQELDSLCRSTEGWISAIRLQLLNYRQTGRFARTADIEQLVKTAIWGRLSSQEREFLLTLCVLDSFTLRQACLMYDTETLPDSLLRLVEENAFIRYDPAQNRYIIHSILQDYLRSLFYHCYPERLQLEILRRAGKAACAAGDYFAAARFYSAVGDLESVLSLPFDGAYLNNQKEKDLLSFMTGLLEECGDELLIRHPMTCIAFAFQLFMGGQTAVFARLCAVLSRMLKENQGLDGPRRRQIAGELALLESFQSYNDIAKMSQGHRTALALLDGPSTFLRKSTAWTIMNISVLWMFWRQPGALDTELALMNDSMPIYNRLTSGHGYGAEVLMCADAMLLRGMDSQAEIYAHQAHYMAQSQGQTGLAMCAELILARAALLRGDGPALTAARGRIEALAAGSFDHFVRRICELCGAWLDLTLGRTEHLPDWLLDPKRMEQVLYVLALPLGQVLYGRYLLLTGQLQELLGLTEPMRDVAGRLHCLSAELYHLLHLSAAWHAQGDEEQARQVLDRALALALPDRVLLPFAELYDRLKPLLDEAADRVPSPELQKLCRRQADGVHRALGRPEPVKFRLTQREQEIARLAQRRLTAREISAALFISESTVRSALKIIYSKLEIHSKCEGTTYLRNAG